MLGGVATKLSPEKNITALAKCKLWESWGTAAKRGSEGFMEIEYILVSFKMVKTGDNRNQSQFFLSSHCECNLLQHSPWELPPSLCPKEDLGVKLSFQLYQNKQRQGQAARGMKSQLSATPKYFLLEQFVSWQTSLASLPIFSRCSDFC